MYCIILVEVSYLSGENCFVLSSVFVSMFVVTFKIGHNFDKNFMFGMQTSPVKHVYWQLW